VSLAWLVYGGSMFFPCRSAQAEYFDEAGRAESGTATAEIGGLLPKAAARS